jgi:hypothetical protein
LLACRLWPQVDTWASAGSQIAGAGLIQGQLLGDCGKEFLNVGGSFGGSFEEEETRFFGVGFGIGGLNSTLIGIIIDHVSLVSGEGDDNVLVCLSLQFLDPRLGLV